MQEFATKYNELRATIEDEIYSAEAIGFCTKNL